MFVRLGSGLDARIEFPFMIFMNKDRGYPICETSGDITGVYYITGPKRWVDTTLFPQWLGERRFITALPQGRKLVL